MRRKQDLEPKEKKPPSPLVVGALSLFGYPGLGHFMVGRKKLGTIIVVLFTLLTVGVLYEIYVTAWPIVKMYMDGTAMASAPNWGRVGFWIVSTGIVWLFSGVHSFLLARDSSE